jgi:serine/threonine protein kinase
VTFMSPERINGESYSTPSDVWSLGLSLMTCALGKIPLRTNKGYWSLLQCVRDEDPPSLPEDGRWSDELIDFCKKAMVKDPNKRATCDELLTHPFLKLATSTFNGSAEGLCSGVKDQLEADGDEEARSMDKTPAVKKPKEVDHKVGEDEVDEEKEEKEETLSPLRSRLRSASNDGKDDEIGYVLREGAEKELDDLLRALYYHVDGLFASKRQSCLALLNAKASEAENALKAIDILLHPSAQPRRKSPSTGASKALASSLDSLDRLALQLNLPVSVVRRRVDILTSEGIDAIKRHPPPKQLLDDRRLEESFSKDIIFDTLDSSGASHDMSSSRISVSDMKSPNSR